MNSVDLFAGCGGLTEGLKMAGFSTIAAVEVDHNASRVYKLNHTSTQLITRDIRKISNGEIEDVIGGRVVHLLAGCPPCQGFSKMRTLNRCTPVQDERNELILEYLRFVEVVAPLTIMMENVPGLRDYALFKKVINRLKELKYNLDVQVVNVKGYGVPQGRKRLVLVGSKLAEITVAPSPNIKKTVRETIEGLPLPENSIDPLHKIFPKHTKRVMERIRLTPKDGGSRSDLPASYTLACHKRENVGFQDVYGRLRWDDYSTTITGGCLNPSKGRFLHPEQDRNISAREAALLQSFPIDYIMPTDIPKSSLALLIGNALPPRFSQFQALNIRQHISKHM